MDHYICAETKNEVHSEQRYYC